MRLLACALLFCGSLCAQNFSFYIDASNGAKPADQLPALTNAYAFTDTPVGSATSIVVRVVNTGTVQAPLDVIYIGAASGSPTANPNFSVTGFQTSSIIAAGAFKLFTLSFTPGSIGMSYGYLQASTGSGTFSIATLMGNGLTPQLTVSCQSSLAPQCSGSTLQPNSASIINFGSAATTASLIIPFTLTNLSATAVNPQSLISIQTSTNNPNSAFSLSTLPATLAGGTALNFSLIFAPGAAVTYRTNLLVGSVLYPIQATGTSSVVGDISSLVITYTDSSGVRLTAQPGSAIDFGSSIAKANNSIAYTVSVANPATTIDPVQVNVLSVTGAGFALTGAPSLPASIAPGANITFKIVFAPTATGSYTGVLAIGTRQFNLTGKGTVSAIPDASFQVDVNPLLSQKQAHLSITFSSASPVATTGTLSLSFTPSIDVVKDDPAILFLATGGRQLNVAIAQGAQAATFNSQPSITFQTGTTAGTIKFVLSFADGSSYNQSYVIAPTTIQITSSSALSQSPYLVVNMTGYDNTYSAGKMVFTFYDSSGAAITAQPVSVDFTNDFKNFFTSSANQTGSAFNVQLKFPIVGDISKIVNMGIVMTNSAGTLNVNQ